MGIIGKTEQDIVALQEFQCNDKDNAVNTIIGSEQFVMYFTFNNDIYGVMENARMIYANIIHPDPSTFASDRFFATNLSSSMEGKTYQRVFTKQDIPNMHIIHSNQVANLLKA